MNASETITEKLDRLAEFYSQKDSIEAKKRALLDEVKIPDEIIDVQRQAAEAVEYNQKASADILAVLSSKRDAALDAVQIPQEIRAALAEIDKKRAEIRAEYDEKMLQVQRDTSTYRAEVSREMETKTRKVYADIEQRKREIAAEFADKEQDAAANIEKLEAEIKADTKNAGQSFKGKYFHAVYVRGRITWNTDKMEAWIVDHPFLKEARKEGEPSVTLRKI